MLDKQIKQRYNMAEQLDGTYCITNYEMVNPTLKDILEALEELEEDIELAFDDEEHLQFLRDGLETIYEMLEEIGA